MRLGREHAGIGAQGKRCRVAQVSRLHRLVLFLSILLLTQGAWASEIPQNEEVWGYGHLKEMARANAEFDKAEQEKLDRFLDEKVQPEVEAGDTFLTTADGRPSWSAPQMKMSESQTAIAHYLKALVEIEMERLRRGK